MKLEEEWHHENFNEKNNYHDATLPHEIMSFRGHVLFLWHRIVAPVLTLTINSKFCFVSSRAKAGNGLILGIMRVGTKRVTFFKAMIGDFWNLNYCNLRFKKFKLQTNVKKIQSIVLFTMVVPIKSCCIEIFDQVKSEKHFFSQFHFHKLH